MLQMIYILCSNFYYRWLLHNSSKISEFCWQISWPIPIKTNGSFPGTMINTPLKRCMRLSITKMYQLFSNRPRNHHACPSTIFSSKCCMIDWTPKISWIENTFMWNQLHVCRVMMVIGKPWNIYFLHVNSVKNYGKNLVQNGTMTCNSWRCSLMPRTKLQVISSKSLWLQGAEAYGITWIKSFSMGKAGTWILAIHFSKGQWRSLGIGLNLA